MWIEFIPFVDQKFTKVVTVMKVIVHIDKHCSKYSIGACLLSLFISPNEKLQKISKSLYFS